MSEEGEFARTFNRVRPIGIPTKCHEYFCKVALIRSARANVYLRLVAHCKLDL